jgi:hypothetical protein
MDDFGKPTHKFHERRSYDAQVARILEKVENIEKKVEKIELCIEKNYITRQEFAPVKNIVYAMVGLVLAGVLTALIALVVQK